MNQLPIQKLNKMLRALRFKAPKLMAENAGSTYSNFDSAIVALYAIGPSILDKMIRYGLDIDISGKDGNIISKISKDVLDNKVSFEMAMPIIKAAIRHGASIDAAIAEKALLMAEEADKALLDSSISLETRTRTTDRLESYKNLEKLIRRNA